MSKLPATKSRQPLASLNQPAATLAADERGGNLAAGNLNITPTDIGGNNFQNVSGSNNIQIYCYGEGCKSFGNISINSDVVIQKLLDVIAQQTAQIGELTDKVISQASEIIDLKLKLNGLQL